MTIYSVQTRMKGTHAAEWDHWSTLPGCRILTLHTAVCMAMAQVRSWRHTEEKEEVKIFEHGLDGPVTWAYWSTEFYGNNT